MKKVMMVLLGFILVGCGNTEPELGCYADDHKRFVNVMVEQGVDSLDNENISPVISGYRQYRVDYGMKKVYCSVEVDLLDTKTQEVKETTLNYTVQYGEEDYFYSWEVVVHD